MKKREDFQSEKCQNQALVFTTSFGKSFTVAMLLLIALNATAQDSTRSTTLQILPRLHSSGYFPFTGALLNHNPVADVNVFYERKSLGFFVFQSFDLKDRHSYANYFQPGVFATWKLRQNFKVRGFFGYIFSQTQGFRDPNDSDYYAAATMYWDPAKHLSVQNTVLFYDYNIQRKLANRLLISCSYPKFKADLFLWNRTVLVEKRQAISASFALTYSIALTKKTSVQITGSYMRYLTSYKPSYALDDGFIFTVAVPVNVIE